MNEWDTKNLISVTAQRFIAANEVQTFVDYLRELGVSDKDLKEYCYEYIIVNSDLVEEDGLMEKHYCENCGKLQTEVEYLVGQCNDCDPFEDPELLEELFGEAEYLD